MHPKLTLIVPLAGLLFAASPRADASVVYEVFNPTVSPTFVFFVYDSPGFITTDTLVPASSLAFNNAVHPVKTVDFIIDSPMPGLADVQITINPHPPIPTVQDKFVPPADLAGYGTYQFAPGSFGFPNSYLLVAAAEPAGGTLFGVGLLGLLALHRVRRRSAPLSETASM